MGNAQCCEAAADCPTEAIDQTSSVPALTTDEVPDHEDDQSPKGVDTTSVEIRSIPTLAKIEEGDEASPKSAKSGQDVYVSPKKKAHMQAYARDFVRDMEKGKEVQLLTHKAESLEPARAASQCTLDSKLQFLSLSSKEGDVKATVAKIKNVCGVEEDGKAAFPTKVLELIAPEEHDKLLLVKYDLEDGKEANIIIVEDSLESRKRFAECMRYIVQSMQKGS